MLSFRNLLATLGAERTFKKETGALPLVRSAMEKIISLFSCIAATIFYLEATAVAIVVLVKIFTAGKEVWTVRSWNSLHDCGACIGVALFAGFAWLCTAVVERSMGSTSTNIALAGANAHVFKKKSVALPKAS